MAVCLAAFVAASAVTIVTAYGLAVLIERPCIRLGRRWSEPILDRQGQPAEAPAPVRAGWVFGLLRAR